MKNKKSVSVALGTFDGLHWGHIAVLNKALSIPDTECAAVTFKEPPKVYTGKSPVGMILSSEAKREKLYGMGVAHVRELCFEKVKDTPPDVFLRELFSEYSVKALVCGENYRFGKGGSGDTQYLAEFGKDYGAEVCIVPFVCDGDKTVSSTLIRELISGGEVQAANGYLTEPYFFESTVEHGDSRGRTLGFPTVNQTFPGFLVQPAPGVYVSLACVDGEKYRSVTNIGKRPTFVSDGRTVCETHIIGFTGDLYGKNVKISLLDRIRDEKTFSSSAELVSAIREDIELAKREIYI